MLSHRILTLGDFQWIVTTCPYQRIATSRILVMVVVIYQDYHCRELVAKLAGLWDIILKIAYSIRVAKVRLSTVYLCDVTGQTRPSAQIACLRMSRILLHSSQINERMQSIMTITYPEIIVESDYDGYFERLVRGWCDKKTMPFRHKKIIITAGPYRSCAVSAMKDDEGKTIRLDFYAALRTGFGQLDSAEINEIINNWL
jgi:hypothetical protein